MISILIPYKGDNDQRDRIFAWVVNRYRALFPEAEIIVGSSADEPFNRSRARNDAFDHSTGDVLIIADADTVVNQEAITAGIATVNKTGGWVLPYTVYYNLTPDDTDKLLQEPPDLSLQQPAQWDHRLLTAVSGVLIMRRSAYEAVGGYDERFRGWSFEDNAFSLAMETLHGSMMRRAGFCLHMWHPAPNETTWGQPHLTENRALYQQYEARVGQVSAMRQFIQDRRR